MRSDVAVYPGSFDPFTLGHLDILLRAKKMFSRIIVAVAIHHSKQSSFSLDERVSMIERVIAGYEGIEVVSFEGLITTFLKEEGVSFLVRGIRDATDFLYESKMSRMNHIIYPEMDTVFLHTSERFAHISSSLVKEIARYQGDLVNLVPSAILSDIVAHFENSNRS